MGHVLAVIWMTVAAPAPSIMSLHIATHQLLEVSNGSPADCFPNMQQKEGLPMANLILQPGASEVRSERARLIWLDFLAELSLHIGPNSMPGFNQSRQALLSG